MTAHTMTHPFAHAPEPTASPANAIDLFWTGGWDSTFRLLQLLLHLRVPVVPHYLEDPARASTATELRTMARIAERLRATYPHTRALLQPLRVTPVSALAVDGELAAALAAVRERVFIGSQYAWLPAYCRRHAIADMELGVHVDDKVQALLREFVEPFDHPGGYRSLRVAARHAGTPEHTLFRHFSFPLFAIDKSGIDRQAAAAGWRELMEMTWFCHTPVRGRPCGFCAPCAYTIDEGLARRVPRSRRALSFVYRRLLVPIKDPLRRARATLR
ncbi:hypothetical protein ACFOED_09360 [Vulcaniibacterium thermophilum]|nr:hypothetical protein [Vulcaniibacterium thermophilum]